jgi:two-component system sensor histidine kinase TctE
MPRVGAERSVRWLLFGWLVVPVAVVLAASGYAAHRSALAIASEAYDRALLNPALAIAQRLQMTESGIELDMLPVTLDALRVDVVDRVFFTVSVGGRAIAGATELAPPPDLPDDGAPVFYDTRIGDDRVRVAAIAVPVGEVPVVVQVAETVVKRERLLRQVLLSNVLPELAFLGVAVLAVWFGIARGLAPLDALHAELAARSHRDLRPVPESRAPAEVRPLVRELNKLLGRLAESIDSQQRFVADAAHQLRTPLAALQAQVDAARRQPMPPELAPTLDQLFAATRRASHLARQLLTLAAVDPAAERPFSPEPLDLAQVLQAGVTDWIARADARQADLGFELEPAPLAGEPLLLKEAAANLLDNALAYSGPGAVVTLRSGRRNGAAFLEVEDNGPGIPESEREQVFRRFHRVKGSPGQGSGLGLAIVREIALRHGASVTIGSPPSGRGTVVTLVFPAQERRAPVSVLSADRA